MPEEKKQPEKEEKPKEEKPEEIPPADVYSVIKWLIGILSSQAWQYMGLIANPLTQKIDKDLNQAKIAIDCVAFLIDQIKPNIPEAEYKSYKGLLSDLQVNFIEQSRRQ